MFFFSFGLFFFYFLFLFFFLLFFFSFFFFFFFLFLFFLFISLNSMPIATLILFLVQSTFFSKKKVVIFKNGGALADGERSLVTADNRLPTASACRLLTRQRIFSLLFHQRCQIGHFRSRNLIEIHRHLAMSSDGCSPVGYRQNSV